MKGKRRKDLQLSYSASSIVLALLTLFSASVELELESLSPLLGFDFPRGGYSFSGIKMRKEKNCGTFLCSHGRVSQPKETPPFAMALNSKRSEKNKCAIYSSGNYHVKNLLVLFD